MTVSEVGVYSVMGWHTEASSVKEGVHLALPNYNVGRILGCLPILGAFGSMQLWTAAAIWTKDEDPGTIRTEDEEPGIIQTEDEDRDLSQGARVYVVVRGAFEMLGLGLLFLVPDVAVSVHRHFLAEPNVQKV